MSKLEAESARAELGAIGTTLGIDLGLDLLVPRGTLDLQRPFLNHYVFWLSQVAYFVTTMKHVVGLLLLVVGSQRDSSGGESADAGAGGGDDGVACAKAAALAFPSHLLHETAHSAFMYAAFWRHSS